MFEGFQVYNTGGGCEALMRELNDGGFVLVTDDNLCVPGPEGMVCVGYYKDEDALTDGIATGAGDFDARDEEAIECMLAGLAARHGGWK